MRAFKFELKRASNQVELPRQVSSGLDGEDTTSLLFTTRNMDQSTRHRSTSVNLEQMYDEDDDAD